MKKLFVLYILLSANLIWANNDVETLRKIFIIASEDANKAKALYHYFEKKETISEPTELAYKGATIALMAKFSNGLYTKLSYINKSLDIINQAVKSDPSNFEIRYLRFSVERNLPPVLNRSKNIEKDTEIILNHLKNKNCWNGFETDIARDLINSNRLSETQKSVLVNHLNQKSNA